MLIKSLIEVRFKTSSRFLESRSEIIERNKRYFEHWRATGINNLSLSDESGKMRGFVTSNNAAVDISDPTEQVFKDISNNFLNNVFDILEIEPKTISRIGVKNIYSQIYNGNFEELVSAFKEKLLKYDSGDFLGNSEITDIGFAIDFRIGDVMCKSNAGPMELSQFQGMVPDSDKLPGIGVYTDLDFYRDNFEGVTPSIKDYINDGLVRGKEFSQKIKNILEIT